MAPSSNLVGVQHQGGVSVGHQAGWCLLVGLHLHLECQDLSGSIGQIACLAERLLSDLGGHQGLGVSAGLGRYEADSVVLVETQGTTGSETGDTVGIGGTAGIGSRVDSGYRAVAAAEAAAAAGSPGSGPKV